MPETCHVSANHIRSLERTRILTDFIEKNRDKVAGAIISLDATQIGPDGVTFSNRKVEMFKSAQILLHCCLLFYDIKDLYSGDSEYSRTKKMIHIFFHVLLMGLSCYQLYLHAKLHYEGFTCNSEVNHFIINSNGTVTYSIIPTDNELCLPVEVLFWIRTGVVFVVASMKVISIKQSYPNNVIGFNTNNLYNQPSIDSSDMKRVGEHRINIPSSPANSEQKNSENNDDKASVHSLPSLREVSHAVHESHEQEMSTRVWDRYRQSPVVSDSREPYVESNKGSPKSQLS
tara:strand:+ start:3757 stop:4617 length:861 start_codon:yes stop_codon:yes gene_type:complete